MTPIPAKCSCGAQLVDTDARGFNTVRVVVEGPLLEWRTEAPVRQLGRRLEHTGQVLAELKLAGVTAQLECLSCSKRYSIPATAIKVSWP